jgi:hypothetical protein
MSAFENFIFGREKRALEDIEIMLNSPGTEEKIAAAFTLALVKENKYIDLAIEVLGDCQTDLCTKTSELAPFKEIGMVLALSEIYGKKGDWEKYEMTLMRAETLAIEANWPFMERFKDLRDNMKSNKAKWDQARLSVGSVAFPLLMFTDPGICAGCHFGAKIKESDYLPGSDSTIGVP